MILSDCPELREIEWRCVIIDEAHRLKNRNCKLLDSLKHMDLVSSSHWLVGRNTWDENKPNFLWNYYIPNSAENRKKWEIGMGGGYGLWEW